MAHNFSCLQFQNEGLALLLMIEVHRLNGEAFLLNSDMIETIDVTPDTVLRLLNGHRYVVKEKVGRVQENHSLQESSRLYMHRSEHRRRNSGIIRQR